jgi:prepilin-type N-terminal cleavage/methylation domain-containing protein
MTRGRAPRRAGFTLIELLVVIALIAALAAITAGAVARVKAVQQVKASEQLLDKLQTALDTQWKLSVEESRKDAKDQKIPPAVFALCDGDPDRALAFWTYAKLRREFPQSFAEALGDPCPNPAQLAGTAPFSAPDNRRAIWVWYPANNANPAVPILFPRKTFATVGGAGTPTDEAAALLYLILAEKGLGGTGGAADDMTLGSQMDIGTGRVFKDSWGQPVTFVRLAENGELDNPPFVNPKTFKDALDPKARLFTFPVGNWNSDPVNKNLPKDRAEIALGTWGLFDGHNKMITVISSGPNKQFEGYANATGTTDDIYGYRLRKLGARGD